VAPTREQYDQLRAAGELSAAGPAQAIDVQQGRAVVHISLPRQAVVLLIVEAQ